MNVRQQIKRRARHLQREQNIGYAQAQKIVAQEMWDELPQRIGPLRQISENSFTVEVGYELLDGQWHTEDDVARGLRRYPMDPEEEEFLRSMESSPTCVKVSLFEFLDPDLLPFPLEKRGEFVRLRVPGVAGVADRIDVVHHMIRRFRQKMMTHQKNMSEYEAEAARWDELATRLVWQLPAEVRPRFRIAAVLINPRLHLYREVRDAVRSVMDPATLKAVACEQDEGFPGEAHVRELVLSADEEEPFIRLRDDAEWARVAVQEFKWDADEFEQPLGAHRFTLEGLLSGKILWLPVEKRLQLFRVLQDAWRTCVGVLRV